MRRAIVLVPLALLVAACGARSNTPFTAQASIGCLKEQHFTGATTSPGKVGFIAGFAANGGIHATAPSGNTVTIAFTEDADHVEQTEKAFRLHAPPALRPHMSDVLRVSRNAVIVWTTAPSTEDEQTVEGCLAS